MHDVDYAVTNGTHIAYTVLDGSGSVDVVMLSGAFFPVDALLEDRISARFIEGLASLGRLVVFDKRGTGLSDPMTDWERSAQAQWGEDLLAVVASAGLNRPVLVSWETLGTGRLAVSARPDLFAKLILINPGPSVDGFRDLYLRTSEPQQQQEGEEDPGLSVERLAFPSRIDDAEFWAWMSRAGRSGASPAASQRLWAHVLGGYDGPYTPPDIATPTLVLHVRDCIASEEMMRAVVDEIAGSELVQVPGVDMYPIAGDVDLLTTEIALFVTGSTPVMTPQRATSAVLFTDIVASTERAADEGDRRWRTLLDLHDEATLQCVERRGGRIVKYTGDGVLALLPSAEAAILVAQTLGEQLLESSIEIRAGVHVGDVDVRGEDVSGITVNVAARIMSLAGPGEVLVSESVRLATLGSGFIVRDTQTVELHGVPELWTIHRWAGQS